MLDEMEPRQLTEWQEFITWLKETEKDAWRRI